MRVPALDFDGTTGLDDEADGFDAAMRAFFASALRVARAVLSALERRLEAPAGWFEATYGPLEDHAQWHVKRFVPGEASPHAVTADGDIARSSNQRAMGWMGLDGVGWGWMGLDGVGAMGPLRSLGLHPVSPCCHMLSQHTLSHVHHSVHHNARQAG